MKSNETVKTAPTPSPATAPAAKPRVGLALAGGGPLGAVYEIGALAAIEEAIEGLDLTDAAVYVGISAGGIIAAGLANGITPYQMCWLFVESDENAARRYLFRPEIMLKPAWAEFRKRAMAVPRLVAQSLLHYIQRRGTSSLASSFARLSEALPAGVFSGTALHDFIEHSFSLAGRTNDFRKLKNPLILVATDLDSGEPVRFGEPGLDDVPISKAAQASAAAPGLFVPVEINGRSYVDGVLRKTLHASIALDRGIDVLICLNPIVPYNAKVMYFPGKLAEGGLLTVLSQSLRSIIHSRVEVGMKNYASRYPDSDILLLQPSPEDADMFFTNLFSTSNRSRMCEHAYQSTRAWLWKHRDEVGRKLERHGLRLKTSVLRNTSLTLVKNPPMGKRDRYAVGNLTDALDTLERYLKVAA